MHDPSSDRPSLAERLGFAAGDRVAVVHADDVGMCHAANLGAFAAMEAGSVTCGSAMVPCPWFREAADRARARPAVDLGVHLTLNSEWPHYRWGPVAGRGRVPSLLDDQGYLPRTVGETLQRAKAEEVEVELRAQIEHALASGVDVTHLDAHMGTAFFPPFVEIYVKLAREYRVPALAARPDPASLAAAGLAGAESLLHGVCDALESAGFPVLDAIDANSLSFEPGRGEAHNEARLDALGPGVTYLILHPAQAGEELDAICPESAHARAFERDFYGGARGAAALESRGIRTVGMRALLELVRGR